MTAFRLSSGCVAQSAGTSPLVAASRVVPGTRGLGVGLLPPENCGQGRK